MPIRHKIRIRKYIENDWKKEMGEMLVPYESRPKFILTTTKLC